jgi:hypothetical protein
MQLRDDMNAISTARGLGAALVLLATAACGSAAGNPASSSATSPPATPAAPSPSADGTWQVTLRESTGHDVTVEVDDQSGRLIDASSGDPGDGASVEPYTLRVRNVDPTVLELVWVGGPCDATSTLAIDRTASRFLLVQPECPGDAIALDRRLVLTFSEPVDAADVETSLQDGLDTSS